MKTGVARRLGGCAAVFGVVASGLYAAIPPVPVPPQNPITEPKRVLGKILFWDEQLSTSNTVSCGTCHTPATAGTESRPPARNPGVDGLVGTPDDILGSPGVVHSNSVDDYKRDPVFALNPQITGRSANSMINAAFVIDAFWDGRARSQFTDPQTGSVVIPVGGALESQSVGPPVSSVEMAHEGNTWNLITSKLARARPLDLATNMPPDVAGALAGRPSYPELFRRAFGDGQITATRIAFALATYERTLISDQAPFDAFRAGVPNALTPGQVQGFNEFQVHSCAVCHTVGNDLFTGQTFRNVGLRPPTEDLGRQNVTGNAADRGRFKVPSLRNVGLKRTFMHNGQFQTLTDVIRFYARAPGAAPQFPDNRDPVMNAVVPLGPQDAGPIQDFLQNALTDPRVAAGAFPFDRPTLFSERGADRPTLQGGGTTGSGGFLPLIVVEEPPMVGNTDFRVGLDSALGGAQATLAFSFAPPVNGVITPSSFVGSITVPGIGVNAGPATLSWPLLPESFQPGQVAFVQWFVTDPAAAGGTARSQVVRVPFFCGSSGCAVFCAADFDRDGGVTVDDLLGYLLAFDVGGLNADLDDGSATGTPDTGVTIDDLLYFLARFDAGC